MSGKSVAFVELQFVRFEQFVLKKNVICVLHFPVDLKVSEAKVGGCRQKPVDLLNCNLSSEIFSLSSSFSC